MENYLIAFLLVILLLVLYYKKCSEGLQDWIDFDIARDSPDPRQFLYVYREKDSHRNTPLDYYLQNKLWTEQGLILNRDGWDKFRPSISMNIAPDLM
jgi:hypothetical protein